MKDTVKNLEALRQAMRKSHVDAVIIPGTDPHQSEYTSVHWKLRDWVTGFTGSNGTAVVTLTDAGLWTDSRYFLQAEQADIASRQRGILVAYAAHFHVVLPAFALHLAHTHLAVLVARRRDVVQFTPRALNILLHKKIPS